MYVKYFTYKIRINKSVALLDLSDYRKTLIHRFIPTINRLVEKNQNQFYTFVLPLSYKRNRVTIKGLIGKPKM